MTGETYGPANDPIYTKNCKRYIKVVNGNGDVRFLILPAHSDQPIVNVHCKALMGDEYNKLIEKTKLPTMERRKQMAEEYLMMRNKKTEEVANRKKEMVKIMDLTEKSRRLNALEKENDYKKRYTLARAKQLILDEDDDVKEFNQMIALKKCIATWDAQILEKEKILSDRKKEKKRLEREAEERRKYNYRDDERKRQNQRERNQMYIAALNEQIKEREDELRVQAELKNIARKRFNKAAKQAEIDEQNLVDAKNRANAIVREEQQRVNILLQRLQAVDKEEDRIFYEKMRQADEEMNKKLVSIEAIKKEIEDKRKEELAKMVAEKLRKEEEAKFKDLMEETLRMDNTERSWRQKELMEQREKRRGLDEMYAQLEKQVLGARLSKAQVIEDERRELCKIAKDNIEDDTKDREAQRNMKLASEEHRMEILLQINDIDRKRIQDREDKIMESRFYKIQREKRNDEARNAMLRRLEQVRKDGLPEKYVRDLEEYVYEKFGGRKRQQGQPKNGEEDLEHPK
ncbi:hypothetical protein O3M35_006951 [Rhynocoris fuscipes]|uniref:Cilia- and flagella-associated protein 45 n=1 Tax=Rhynocoris fuscipes TaxID=488301 RepID=A0AAW1DMJ5_9HEMI